MARVVQYLQQKFQQISESKIKEGIFLSLQITDLMNDTDLDAVLKRTEKAAWEASKAVHNFLGKHKAHNYRIIVEKILETFKNMGCNMSLKLHFLQSNLAFFLSFFFSPSNLTDIRQEHGKIFHWGNGVRQCLPTAADNLKDIFQIYTEEKTKCKTIQLNCAFGTNILFLLI
jgi:hypothetical protein